MMQVLVQEGELDCDKNIKLPLVYFTYLDIIPKYITDRKDIQLKPRYKA